MFTYSYKKSCYALWEAEKKVCKHGVWFCHWALHDNLNFNFFNVFLKSQHLLRLSLNFDDSKYQAGPILLLAGCIFCRLKEGQFCSRLRASWCCCCIRLILIWLRPDNKFANDGEKHILTHQMTLSNVQSKCKKKYRIKFAVCKYNDQQILSRR